MEMIAWITRLMEVDMGPDAAARVVALTGAGAQMVRVFAARVAP